jgi:hypothetical protein
VSLKLNTHPPAAHVEAAPPFSALANIHSVPPATFGFATSVTGEHSVLLVDRTGPAVPKPFIARAAIATWYRMGGPPVLPQTLKFACGVDGVFVRAVKRAEVQRIWR